jgi:hypothetical protein
VGDVAGRLLLICTVLSARPVSWDGYQGPDKPVDDKTANKHYVLQQDLKPAAQVARFRVSLGLDTRFFNERYGEELWVSKSNDPMRRGAPMPADGYTLDFCLLLTPMLNQLNMMYVTHTVFALGGESGEAYDKTSEAYGSR